MRTVISIPFHNEKENQDNYTHYEWIAIVIQKSLEKIVGKMRKDIDLTDGDTVSIYEISLTFFAVVK